METGFLKRGFIPHGDFNIFLQSKSEALITDTNLLKFCDPKITVIDERTKEILRKKGYGVYGHSAVEICTWTKKSIRGLGECYKNKFYGVKTHSCAQVSPAFLWCHHRCVYCWRPTEYMERAPPRWMRPEEIIPALVKLRRELLIGIRGAEDADPVKVREALDEFPKHWAISLSGEPTLYPYLPEFIDEVKKRGAETIFVVTNGQEPEMIRKIARPPLSQLYISVNAPNEELYKRIAKPIDGSFERILQSFKARGDFRTVARITLIRGYNTEVNFDEWAAFFEQTRPWFIEVKAYMWIGHSQMRLTKQHMPTMDEIRAYAQKLAEATGYVYEDEHEPSRIALLKRPGVERWLLKPENRKS